MKNLLKYIADSICMVIMIPVFITYWVLGTICGKDGVFWGFSQALCLLPGVPGNFFRKTFYRLAMSKCDRECAILFGTIFSNFDTEIGKGVYIGPNCNIGKCRIEDYCTIGSNVHIMSGRHQHSGTDITLPMREQGGVFERVNIGEDTWIGNCALIMANIGKKCIVGAGAVVTKDVEEFSIVAGNPARVIKRRM